jgi:uncharacterized membrane protein
MIMFVNELNIILIYYVIIIFYVVRLFVDHDENNYEWNPIFREMYFCRHRLYIYLLIEIYII